MLPPYEVLEQLGIKSSDTVADIGCGIGYFSLPASEYLDNTPVYSLDLQDEMLDEIKSRIGNRNIIPIKNEPYDFKLPESSIDFALIVTVIHEVDDKEKFLTELKRVLKPGGRLAVVDWQKKELKFGPPSDHKFSPEQLIEIFKGHLDHKLTIDFNEYFFGMVFVNNI